MKIAIYHVNCSLIHFMACHFGSQLNFFNMHNMFLDFYQQFFFSYFWCDVHFCSTWPPSLERNIYLLICVHVLPNVYNCFRNCTYSYNLIQPFSGNKEFLVEREDKTCRKVYSLNSMQSPNVKLYNKIKMYISLINDKLIYLYISYQ